MAKTVNTAFEEFNKNSVNLNPERSKKARSSRDWLFGQLNKLDGDAALEVPYKYAEMHCKFGSFARNTKIRELDDVDILFCLTANDAIYHKNDDTYVIDTKNAGQRLKNLSDSGILNSSKVVNKIKMSLADIEHYKSADLHSRGEAVTLDLLSYEWVFDIVPCFYTDTGLYLIPDGLGNWKPTDPRIDQSRVSDINQTHDGIVLQLIRTLKYWNRHHSSYTAASYLLECIVINYVDEKSELSKWIDFDIRDFLKYYSTVILQNVNDPKGFQGDLNTLSIDERLSVSRKADWAHSKAIEAVNSELNEKNQEKSINKWREIFGKDFPYYG